MTPCFCRLSSNYAAYHKLTFIRVKSNQNVSRIKSSMERPASAPVHVALSQCHPFVIHSSCIPIDEGQPAR